MGLPTLSQIHAWDTDHLVDAADHWSASADRWETAFTNVWQEAHSVSWEGHGANALRERASADKTTVAGHADTLHDVAAIARRGAGDIGAAQRKGLYAIDAANNAGFRVDEDLSVTDKRISHNAGQRAARRAQAQAFAADIRSRAAQLAALDTEVATNITGAGSGIGTTMFGKPNDGNGSHVQLVDNHHKCTDDQADVERKIESAVIGGAMIGGVADATTGPGAVLGALAGGAVGGVGAAIDEATTGGSRYSGCE